MMPISCWLKSRLMPVAVSSRMTMMTLIVGCCFMAGRSVVVMAENDNLSVSSVASSETIKIGNTKTNHYNMQNSNFLPTQLTQVVLNVPKIGKKLRRTRQPTVEEMAIKGKILEVYERARGETSNVYSIHLEHLGRIIRALNPKYIATERVRRVAFADPRDPNSLIPLPEYKPIHFELDLAGGSPLDKLNLLSAKFNELFSWDENIVEEFSSLPDASLEPGQVAFKRVILCLSGHPLCNEQQHASEAPVLEEPGEPVVAAARRPAQVEQVEQMEQAEQMVPQPSYMNEAYIAPYPQQQQQQRQPYYQPEYVQPSYANNPLRHQQQPVMQQAPQQVPYNQVGPNRRPRLQIPEEVKQRFYRNQYQRNGPHMAS